MSAEGPATAEVIEFQGTTKRFPGVLALDRVDLAIRRGEVHVLVGQNGAGKSTLVKLLCGLFPWDEGRILLDGEPYAPKSAVAAVRAGIRIVYQELNLLPYLSVAENIFFQRLPRRGGLVDFPRLHREAEAMLAEVGLDVSPRARVETLGVAQMQLVEIAKALSAQSKVLILDEPTASLSPREITRLFEIVARLKAKGVTLLYISHRLQEVFEVGDRITVLRNGRKVETLAAREATISCGSWWGRRWGRSTHSMPRCSPARSSCASRSCARAARPTPSPSPCGEGSWWAWRAWSAPGGPRRCARCSAPTRAPPGACGAASARS